MNIYPYPYEEKLKVMTFAWISNSRDRLMYYGAFYGIAALINQAWLPGLLAINSQLLFDRRGCD